MRVGIFGNFYPVSARAGSATTGIAFLLSQSRHVRSIIVYGSLEATVPPGFPPNRIQVARSWKVGSATRLGISLLTLLRSARNLDLVLFSIYPTAFGRNPVANGAGLLIPSLLARLSGRRVVVYMHNFLETQDVTALGYRPGWFTRRAVRTLERWLLSTTEVIVSLPSMEDAVHRRLGLTAQVRALPYVEAVYSATISPGGGVAARTSPDDAAAHVLLFGSWGPQKDLERALSQLTGLIRDGANLRVTIAGGVNPNFPEYRAQFEAAVTGLDKNQFSVVGYVPELEVFPLVRSADVVFLPYRAGGGYSGVMNCAGLAETPIVAYDVPQLREFAAVVGIPVEFVDPTDQTQLERALDRARSQSRKRSPKTSGVADEQLARARSAVEALLEMPPSPVVP